MNLRIFDSHDELITSLARTLVQQITPGEPCSIALSGGSSPVPLFELLGTPEWTLQLSRAPITWVVVDERYVPMDDPQSNAGMISRTLFADGIAPSHRFLRFRTEIDDPEQTAREFEYEWRSREVGTLDIVLLGIGDDGHTASLFPGTAVLDVEDRIAAAVFVPKVDMWRVTITKPVIRNAKLRIVLATGASKAPILKQVREGADLPIAMVTKDVETWWFVDRAAAGE